MVTEGDLIPSPLPSDSIIEKKTKTKQKTFCCCVTYLAGIFSSRLDFAPSSCCNSSKHSDRWLQCAVMSFRFTDITSLGCQV